MAAYNVIRGTVSNLESDRILSKDIEAVKSLMRSEKILEAVEEKVGELR
jgi:histidine ammonia-lyase